MQVEYLWNEEAEVYRVEIEGRMAVGLEFNKKLGKWVVSYGRFLDREARFATEELARAWIDRNADELLDMSEL